MCIDYKPPFIRWFENDFWADRDVILLTWLQRHLYRALLLSAFYCDRRPFLPDDDSQLWKLADAGSPEIWTENRNAILAKFTAFEDEDGKKLLRNKRLDEEWAHLLKSLQRQRNAGLASATNRSSRGSTSVDRGSTSVDRGSTSVDGGSTEVNQSEYRVQSTEPESRVQNQNPEPEKHSPSSKLLDGVSVSSASPSVLQPKSPSKVEAPEGWEGFWKSYPRKVGKPAALAAFKRIAPNAETLEALFAGVRTWAASAQWQDPQFIPHPATFLNQRRWEDTPAPAGMKGPNSDAQRSAPGKYDGLGKVYSNM